MNGATFAALAITVACAAFVQGGVGVGFALVTAPVAALLAPELVPAGLLVLMLPLNAYVAWRERGALDRAGAAWITAGRVAGTAAGAWLVVELSRRGLSVVVGASTIAAVAATALAPAFRPGRRAFVAAGVVTGITETATGVGGPPLALVYQHARAPTLRATVATCFFVGEVVSLAVLAAAGRVDPRDLGVAAGLVPGLLAGAWLSRHVHRRLHDRLLRSVVLAFAALSGLVLLARA